MKHFAPFILVTFLPLSADADYIPTHFADLAGTSEAIVAGTITKVEKETFELTVEDAVVGPVTKDATITVQRFQDWPCAWRWSKYEVGQKVFTFLDFDPAKQLWHVRGSGCEGESPMVDGDVLATFGIPGQRIQFGSRDSSLTPVSYDRLRSAILDFRAKFRLTRSKDPWRKDGEFLPFDQIQFTAPAATSQFRPRTPPPQEFSKRSPLHRYLSDSIDEQAKKMASVSVRRRND